MNANHGQSGPLPVHGGGLDAAARRFGRAVEDWLDLSTGINPRPYPVPKPDVAAWTRLPGAAAMEALRGAAAEAYGAADPATVVAAPGTQALIQLLPRLRRPGLVAVVGPTYAEHQDAWAGGGHRVEQHADPKAAEASGAEVVVLCNPNNPDGRVQAPAALRSLAGRLAARDGLLVVDEAFADADPAISVIGEAAMEGLLVLRSFGKFYGLAGARLGFAVCGQPLARRIDAALGPWAVSGPAAEVGRRALSDAAWRDGTRAWLAGQAKRLDALTARHGLRTLGGTTLFRLVRAPDAWRLYEHLGDRAILTRPFAYDRTWLRLGLPGTAEEFERLDAALGRGVPLSR